MCIIERLHGHKCKERHALRYFVVILPYEAARATWQSMLAFQCALEWRLSGNDQGVKHLQKNNIVIRLRKTVV